MKRDGCDTKFTNVYPTRTVERQQRFLNAFLQHPTIVVAARMAGVHPATVYRWLTDSVFAAAMRNTTEAYFHEHRAKVLAEQATRQRWREAREQQRHAMRCRNLAKAREGKH